MRGTSTRSRSGPASRRTNSCSSRIGPIATICWRLLRSKRTATQTRREPKTRKVVLAASSRGKDFGITSFIHYFAGLLEHGQNRIDHFRFARVDEKKRLVRLDSFPNL